MGKQKPVEYEFDPFELTGLKKPKGAKKRDILRECSDYVKESVLESVGGQNSPVSGYGRFKKLSKGYKKQKSKIASPVPNLELEGDMLNSLKVPVRDGSLVLKVSPGQNDKADGHCNFSGKSRLPLRRFIPNNKDDETFKRPIINGMRRIIKSYEE